MLFVRCLCEEGRLSMVENTCSEAPLEASNTQVEFWKRFSDWAREDRVGGCVEGYGWWLCCGCTNEGEKEYYHGTAYRTNRTETEPEFQDNCGPRHWQGHRRNSGECYVCEAHARKLGLIW